MRRRVTAPRSIPRWRPSAGRRLLRHPVAWWASAALLGLGTLVVTNRLLGDAAAARAEWAERHAVLVASETIEPGAALGVDNTDIVELPRVALPDRFVTELVPGARAGATLHPGEIVHPSRLLGADSSADGSAGNRVAVAVPVGDLVGLLSAGDVVDVWVALDPFFADGGPDTSRRVARSSPVIEVRDTTALLAIGDDEVETLTSALPSGSVTLTIVSRSAPG